MLLKWPSKNALTTLRNFSLNAQKDVPFTVWSASQLDLRRWDWSTQVTAAGKNPVYRGSFSSEHERYLVYLKHR